MATPEANTAALIILQTEQPVMPPGGFMGRDPILTNDRLAGLVASGTARYFLVGRGPFGQFGPARGPQAEWASWVTERCRPLLTEGWPPARGADISAASAQPGAGGATPPGPRFARQFYDCAGAVS